MNRFTPLLETESVVLGRFDHPGESPHRDPWQETARAYSIGFVEQGSFELGSRRQHWQFTPGTVLSLSPGFAFRARHFERQPSDVCLSVRFHRRFVEELAPDERKRFPSVPALPLTNRLAYLRWRLLAVSAGSREPLALETLAAALLNEISGLQADAPARLFKEHLFGWYVERVEAARETLESRYAEPQPLTRLARGVGMSPFHFARTFRALVGAPPHRYLLRVRLERAAERLRAGESVTSACFDSGFTHLSHFIQLFRRTFGVLPSRYGQQRSITHCGATASQNSSARRHAPLRIPGGGGHRAERGSST